MLQYAVRHKRRDYFGMASIPLTTISLASMYGLHSGEIGGRFLSGPWGWPFIVATAVCSIVAFGFAVVGAVIMNGRSLCGWITVAAFFAFATTL